LYYLVSRQWRLRDYGISLKARCVVTPSLFPPPTAECFGLKCIAFWHEIKVSSRITLNHGWRKIVFSLRGASIFHSAINNTSVRIACTPRFLFQIAAFFINAAQKKLLGDRFFGERR
jgi:hypothetical protein